MFNNKQDQMSIDTKHSKLFFVFALASLIFRATLINSDQGYSLIKSLCSDAENNLNTSYKSNLNKLLSSFPSKAGQSSNNGYYATNSTSFKSDINSETIYGLSLCQGDATPNDCQGCVSNAISTLLLKECPKSKSATIWYDNCMVRYSNKSFLTTVDEDVKLRLENKQIAISITPSDASESMILGCNTLFKIAFEMSSSMVFKGLLQNRNRKYYTTREVAYNDSIGIYTMAQCTPDLSANDCDSCLRLLISDMTTFCVNSSRSVRMLNPSCNTKCEIYRLQPPIESPKQPVPKGSSTRRLNFVFVALPASTAISFLVCLAIWHFLRNRNINVDISEIKKAVDSLQFDINQIRAATHNFAQDNKLGEGGFGEVYKGRLANGQQIAVKRLSKESEQGIREFKTEVVLVAKLQHKNLVKLKGFCVASQEKILVYEYLPNSSLDRLLFDQNNKTILDWQTRFKIIVGIARGLLYLHEDSPIKVIHRDLKSSNILLDEDMNPKISDFGLARHFELHQTQGDTKRIVGTFGYMAPEYAITGHYSVKSDIYSFGVIVLEIVSGERNGFFDPSQLEEALLYRSWKLWNENNALDLVDARLNTDFPIEELAKCIHIGLLCIQEYATERPRMNSIVAALTGQAISLPVPKSPHFIGRFVNPGDDQTLIDEQNSPLLFTGTRTITTLVPRH